MIAPLLKAPLAASVLAAVALAPSAAQGQEADPEAEARALFEEGLERADQGDWEAAVERFEGSLARRDSPVVAYNLASAFVRIGRPDRARERLRALLADPEADARVRASAEALLTEVEAQLGTVRLEVANRPRLRLQVDGEARDVTPALELRLPAGPHVIAVAADDGTALQLETEVRAGGVEILRIPAPTSPADETALHWGIGLGITGGALVASLAFVIGMLAAGL